MLRANFFETKQTRRAKKALAFGLAMITLLLLIGVLAPKPAHAATTFTVNKTGDAGDSNIGDTVCDSSDKSGNQCTLRAAIQEANANNNDATVADQIDFAIGGKATVKTINVGSTGNGALPIITEPVT